MASGFHNLPRKSNKVRLPLISLWALFLSANLWIFTVTIIIIIIVIVIIISIWVTIKGGLVTRYRTKKIKFLDFLCSSDCSSIFFRKFSLIPNNASLQEVV